MYINVTVNVGITINILFGFNVCRRGCRVCPGIHQAGQVVAMVPCLEPISKRIKNQKLHTLCTINYIILNE